MNLFLLSAWSLAVGRHYIGVVVVLILPVGAYLADTDKITTLEGGLYSGPEGPAQFCDNWWLLCPGHG